MSNKKQIVLGAFFMTVLGILGYYTLFMTDFALFKKRQELVVHFPEANGLRTGDAVLVAGIRQGRVKSLSFDPAAELARRVTVMLTLDQELPLREGFTIRIADSTVLGGHELLIDPGPPGATPIPTDTVLFGVVSRGALGSVGDFIDKNGDTIQRIVNNLDGIVADVKDGKGTVGRLLRDDALSAQVTSAVDKIDRTFANAASVVEDVRSGKGIVGRLIYDDALSQRLTEVADRLRDIGSNLSTITADAQAGKGTIGRLLKDDVLSDDVAKAVKSIREITEQINSGEGTLGRIVRDKGMADDISAIFQQIKSGEGTVGKLVYSNELYDKVVKIADDLASASDALRSGQGSLGKLVFSSDLYDQVSRALDIVTRALEEYRESAPITAFTAVLFGAF